MTSKRQTHRRTAFRPPGMRSAFGRFHREDRGAILVIGLFFFLITLMIGGLGVDLMYAEARRAQLQSVLDRSTLAAVGSDGAVAADIVIAEWISKSGIDGVTHTVSEDNSVGDITITDANMSIDTHMMRLVGVDSIAINSETRAGSAGTVEVAIVVDNSQKGQNHQGKYTDGVETMLTLMQAAAGSAKVYASVVPYTTAVAVPQEMWDLYNVTEDHTNSRCVEFDDTTFGTVAISPAAALDQFPHFEASEQNGWEPIAHPECRTEATSEISYFMEDPLDVVAALDALVAAEEQHVSAQEGMKWGMAMLDPSTRPVVTSLISGGHVDGALASMPRDYGTEDNYKVLILIFGHQGNTDREVLKSEFRGGYSPIWWDAAAGRMAVYYNDPGGSTPRLWEGEELKCKDFKNRMSSFGGLTEGQIEAFYTNMASGNTTGAWAAISSGSAVPMAWTDVIAQQPLKKFGECIYEEVGKSLGVDPTLRDLWNTYLYDVEEDRDSSDAQLLAACEAAKAAGIIVYTVSDHVFDERDNLMLESCATSGSHYFHESEADQEEAMIQIGYNLASLITQIKLQN